MTDHRNRSIQTYLLEKIDELLTLYWTKKVRDESANEVIAGIEHNLRNVREKGDYQQSIEYNKSTYHI